MAKTVGDISKSSNRNPMKREKSRQQQNARRRYDTKISQVLKRAFDENVKSRDVQKYLKEHSEVLENKEIEALQKLRLGMEYNKKEKKYELEVKRADEIYKGYESILSEKEELSSVKRSAATQDRRNKLFEREMQQAKSKYGTSEIEGEDVNLFYGSLAPIWRGTSTQETRNSDIMKAFGVSDLETVFKLVTKEGELKASDFDFKDETAFKEWLDDLNSNIKLDKIREIIRQEKEYAKGNKQTGGNTNDAAYNGPTTSHKDGSPTYLMNIIVNVAKLFVND